LFSTDLKQRIAILVITVVQLKLRIATASVFLTERIAEIKAATFTNPITNVKGSAET
jgi:hypothetical protein